MSLELNEILKIAIKGGASDIHLKSGLPPIFRVDGALVPLKNGERLTARGAPADRDVDHERRSRRTTSTSTTRCDLAYGIAGLGRFRVNVFQQRGTVGIVFRVIPFGVKTIEQLRPAQGRRADRDGAPRARPRDRHDRLRQVDDARRDDRATSTRTGPATS